MSDETKEAKIPNEVFEIKDNIVSSEKTDYFFEALGGRKFRFNGNMQDTNILKVWEILAVSGGYNQEIFGGLPVDKVEVEILKKIGVWDRLSPEYQKKLELDQTKTREEETSSTYNLMKKARAARKQKYINVPRELVCTQCGNKISIQPGVLMNRVEKIAKKGQILFTVDDYVKKYLCQVCNPTKGKRPNPEAIGLPKELICIKCKAIQSCSPSSILQRAKKKNLTPQQFLDAYVCQVCNPTRGRRKKK